MFKRQIGITRILLFLSLCSLCLASLGITGCITKPRMDNPDADKEPDHLIILEVFYSGSLLEQKSTARFGKKTTVSYRVDATNPYIKIHNPTKEVKYLDGLGIATSDFQPTIPLKFDKPEQDFTKEYTAVYKVMHFPGTGKDYPINPGETKLLTNLAVDHTKDIGWSEDYNAYLHPANPNSFDLTNADFEWLSDSELKIWDEFEGFKENPKVPNLTKTFFSYSNEPFFNVESNRALLLIDFPKEEFEEGEKLGNLYRKYEWTWQSSVGSKLSNMVGHAYVIPNKSIIDAVVICPNEEYAFNPVDKSIDSGWQGASSQSYGTGSNVKYRTDLNKAIRRIYDGKKWVDTNDSTIDFHVVDASNNKDYSKPTVTTPVVDDDSEYNHDE